MAGKQYPAGSLIVKTGQAFRPHVMDMFEPQDHPDDIPYAGAPPTAPYDGAGWTLAYQMGVQFDRILEGFDGPFEKLTDFASRGRIEPRRESPRLLLLPSQRKLHRHQRLPRPKKTDGLWTARWVRHLYSRRSRRRARSAEGGHRSRRNSRCRDRADRRPRSPQAFASVSSTPMAVACSPAEALLLENFEFPSRWCTLRCRRRQPACEVRRARLNDAGLSAGGRGSRWRTRRGRRDVPARRASEGEREAGVVDAAAEGAAAKDPAQAAPFSTIPKSSRNAAATDPATLEKVRQFVRTADDSRQRRRSRAR